MSDKRDTYLSVDLDFWNKSDFQENFIVKLFESGLPIDVRDQHHHLLIHMFKFKCPRVINLDWHSDLSDVTTEPFCRQTTLNEGTWGNFYPNKNIFTWIYPINTCVNGLDNLSPDSGWCHTDSNPFKSRNPKRICGWKTVCKREGMLTEEEWKRVKAIGISISSDYIVFSRKSLIEKLHKIAKVHGFSKRHICHYNSCSYEQFYGRYLKHVRS